jgi:hypothetical protein
VLILWLFLREVRMTLLISLSIPFSLLITLAWMYFTGSSLDVISMMGLLLAVGMVVDNAIVVIEGIYRLRSQGMALEKSAIEGTAEVGLAILASTGTTMVVFLPVMLMGGDADTGFFLKVIGVPVVVKISYFPNWKVEGAEGPWRIAPNLMVVVPTSQDVRLSFERSWIDVLAYVLTFIGIALLFVWRRLGDVHHATELPSLFEPVNGEDDLDDLDDDATRPMVRDPMVRDDDLLVLTPSRDPDESKDPPDSV